MASGTIKRVESHGGFGFIKGEDDQEYFFHRSGLDGSLAFEDLRVGERVAFDVDQGPRGPRAARVRIAR